MGIETKLLSQFDVLERLYRLPDTFLLTTSEAAVFLRISVSAVESMRIKGNGPDYSQSGGKGDGPNQKCLYEKADLLAWVRFNKISSTMEAAVRKGQLFTSVMDLSRVEAFWIDENSNVLGMVEASPINTVIERLGVHEIVWLSVVAGTSRAWASLADHRIIADQLTSALNWEIQRIAAGVEATGIAESLREACDGHK